MFGRQHSLGLDSTSGEPVQSNHTEIEIYREVCKYKAHLSRQYNCRSLRCSWSCSNYIFILDLTPGFTGLGEDNCKTRRQAFKFGDLVRSILEILRYMLKYDHGSFMFLIGLVPQSPLVIHMTVSSTFPCVASLIMGQFQWRCRYESCHEKRKKIHNKLPQHKSWAKSWIYFHAE